MNNNFKTLFSAALIILSSTALARGPYVAIDSGVFTADFNDVYLNQTASTFPQNIQVTVSQNGYTGGLALGYQSRFHHHLYALGFEVSGNVDARNAIYQSGADMGVDFYDKTQVKDHMDFVLVPRLRLSSTIAAYMKLGLTLGWIQDYVITVNSNFLIANYSNHNLEPGFVVGFGVAKSICRHFNVFAETAFHDYGTVNFSNFQNFAVVYAHNTHVYSYDGVVGAAYKFA